MTISPREIPDDWIEPQLASMGFFPDVGIHIRGDDVVQESSRSTWIGAIVMGCFAILALIPATHFGVSVPYYVQVTLAIGLVFGAACAVIGTKYVYDRFGTRVVVHRKTQDVTVDHGDNRTVVPLGKVIGLQLLRGPSGLGGHQLNLVYQTDSGSIKREMLLTNATRYYVSRIAKGYQRYVGWQMLSTR